MHTRRLIAVASLVLLLTPITWAADATVSVSSTPNTIKLGETKSFTISVAATGNLNIDQSTIPNPGSVGVYTNYTIGSGYGAASQTALFTAPTTVAAGCDTFTSGLHAGECKGTQPVSGGPYTYTGYVTAPTSLTVGQQYTVTIAATSTNGISLGTLPSFMVTVEAADSAPTVVINHPNGDYYLYGQMVNADVTVSPVTADLGVSGCWQPGSPSSCTGTSVDLTFDSDSGDYLGQFGPVTDLCTNTFFATATNNGGTTTESSQFYVTFKFGSWLPPITTSKFQSGRTLPVKFTVLDANGLSAAAAPTVNVNGVYAGTAALFYDGAGSPYYQLNVPLNYPSGSVVTVSVDLGDGACVTNTAEVQARTKAISIK